MGRKTGGFTLIELLVVIAIIGILAGILLATVFQVMDRARRAGAAHDIKNLENALNLYYEKYHSLPDDPYNNYASAVVGVSSWVTDVMTPGPINAAQPAGAPSFMYRLLGGVSAGSPLVNPSRALIDTSIRRLRSTLIPANPKTATDVVFLDPWGSNPYLYVRGIMAMSHPWAAQWPGNREKRCNLWSYGSDGQCQSCASAVVPFDGAMHADGGVGFNHIGGDARVDDDVNNWGGQR